MERVPAQIVELKLTDEQRKYWMQQLVPYYMETMRHTEENAMTIADNKIRESEIGWARAPLDFGQRIHRKTGFVLSKDGKAKSPVINSPKKAKTPSQYAKVFDSLSDSEKEWWDERFKSYVAEFEFNSSSDIPILEQILVEELLQKRLSIQQLLNPTVNPVTSRVMSESSKRMLDLQAKLGITREQRAKELNNIDGNIASVAIEFEEKIAKIMEEQKEKDAEVERLMKEKENEVPLNILPPEDKLLSILGMDDAADDDLLLGEINMDNLTKIIEETQKGAVQAVNASTFDQERTA